MSPMNYFRAGRGGGGATGVWGVLLWYSDSLDGLMAAIWSSLFRQPVFPPTAAPCVRPVGSPATKLPFRRRPAALLTLKHKYPPSPPPHPLPRALSISLPDLLSSIAVSFPIFFFLFASSSAPLCFSFPFTSLLPTCEDLPLAPFVSHLHFLAWKCFWFFFPSLWSSTAHIFTPRYPQSHFPFAAFLFTLNYSWIRLNLITLQTLSFFFFSPDRGFNVNSHQRSTWWRGTKPSRDSPATLFYCAVSMLIKQVLGS